MFKTLGFKFNRRIGFYSLKNDFVCTSSLVIN
jgi:hypothetical protein